MTTDIQDAPRITRQRHDLVRRALSVTRAERLTPKMIRLALSGPELQGFVSGAPDDHFKLFVPDASGESVGRDYTPRHYDGQELIVDVYDHPGGPAADWSRAVKVGDTAHIGGPRGSVIIDGDIAHWLLIGDETAIPAIARRLEELPGGSATVIIAVEGPTEEQPLVSKAALEVTWVHRAAAESADPASLLAALPATLPARSFAWIAAEGGVARALREALLAQGHPLQWLKAAGYWVRGEANASVKAMD
ncbi:siderophore-interacting protein [Citreicella sp. C3M06]|uniref:siderophore-interacting protein n=1 Tax=Citreicella sp. C3M06 TaxID=2841564 RepID=UPI001C080BFD|nr:siderophore-interacting protein [Citreicella sp. C3M06]MBU2963089.1 siderophore-interacting protein [Citreicella sp. C3M06]